MPLAATAKTPHPTCLGVVFGRTIEVKNVPSLGKVKLLDCNDLLCHCGFTFIVFVLLGVVVHGWWCVMYSTGAPIHVHCLESTLLYEMHE